MDRQRRWKNLRHHIIMDEIPMQGIGWQCAEVHLLYAKSKFSRGPLLRQDKGPNPRSIVTRTRLSPSEALFPRPPGRCVHGCAYWWGAGARRPSSSSRGRPHRLIRPQVSSHRQRRAPRTLHRRSVSYVVGHGVWGQEVGQGRWAARTRWLEEPCT